MLTTVTVTHLLQLQEPKDVKKTRLYNRSGLGTDWKLRTLSNSAFADSELPAVVSHWFSNSRDDIYCCRTQLAMSHEQHRVHRIRDLRPRPQILRTEMQQWEFTTEFTSITTEVSYLIHYIFILMFYIIHVINFKILFIPFICLHCFVGCRFTPRVLSLARLLVP